MAVLFDLGDKVSLINSNGSYQGFITGIIYVPASDGMDEFQWIYINNSTVNSQFPSYKWVIVIEE